MRLTPRTRLELQALAKGVARAARRYAPIVLAVGGLEVVGRHSPVDGVDAFGVMMLLVLVAALASRHREWLETWLAGPRAKRLRALSGPWRLEWGVDLRGDPPLESGVPRAWAGSALAITVVCVLLWSFHLGFPTGARRALQSTSGLALLLYTAVLWSSLMALSVSAALVLRELILIRLRAVAVGLRNSVALLFLFCGVAGLLLPREGYLFIVLFTGIGRALLSLTFGPRLNILWRRRDTPPGSTARWGDLRAWDAVATLGTTVAAACLILASGGDRMGPITHTDAAITSLFGLIFGWVASLAGIAFLLIDGGELLVVRWNDPSRQVRGALVVDGPLHAAGRAALERTGLKVFHGGERKPCEVRLKVDGSAMPLDLDPFAPPPGWPLVLPPVDLESPLLSERVVRRDRRQRQRSLVRGVERLFKQAAARDFDGGHGYWLAPHLWFVPTLMREGIKGDEARVGQPYAQLIPRAARSHMHRVLADLEVDLIFVEDGVHARKLSSLLRALFEYHERSGGERLDSEQPIGRVGGLRVVLHELDLARPLVLEEYPEPDYDELGRARILHVFKDRGGGEDRAESPIESDGLPVPVLTPA